MRRIAIFVFYDPKGIVDKYVEYLLHALTEIAEKIVVISNCYLNEIESKKLKKYSHIIYERENRGFDAGAYKDAFVYYLKEENWYYWDEIIMLNDTFYGPIYPFRFTFEKMKDHNVDFWGLTKFENGTWQDGKKIPCHIQSYFLVVRKKLFCSNEFLEFWKDMKYPKELYSAIRDYEIKFTDWFSKLGYRYLAYTDVVDNSYIENLEDNVYFVYTYELIAKSKIPIIKRNSLYLINYLNAKKTLNYIEENRLYDLNLIKNHLKRLDKGNMVKPFGFEEIKRFCRLFSNIYIYGYGKYGHEIKAYMDDESLKVKKFIVTNKIKNEKDVISLQELIIDEDVGIILALSEKNVQQVYLLLENIVPSNQLLIPQY